MKPSFFLLSLLVLPGSGFAADFSDLPPLAQVRQTIARHPAVRAAAAGLAAGSAERERLEAGPHEFGVRLTGQRRQERGPDLSYREYEVGLERGLRLPGKAGIDAELGAAGVEQARFALGDARHESARLLLARWFEWQREAAAAREWAAQVDTLRVQHAAVQKRLDAGDAPRLEVLLSDAQLAQAEAQQMQAATRAERLADELARQFPGIVRPATVPLATPQAPESTGVAADVWRGRIVAENHELAVARAAARRGRLTAQRLEADRLPDPTVGVKLASERDGQERIVGFQISLPLPGQARAAAARAGGAEADALLAREALTLARVETEAHRTVSLAASAWQQWRRLTDVAARMEENARLLDKAWRLGEGQFADLQQARRQAIEARLAATQAQLEANEARYRLLLDAHELWDFDEDEGGGKSSLPD